MPPEPAPSTEPNPSPAPATNLIQPDQAVSSVGESEVPSTPAPVPADPTPVPPVGQTPLGKESASGLNLDPRAGRSNRPIYLGAGMILVLALLGGYFYVAPHLLATNYLKLAPAARAELEKPVQTAAADLARAAFSSSTSIDTQDRIDVDTSIKDIAAAKGAYDNHIKVLSGLTVLPGTSWLKSVKSAQAMYKSNQSYLKATNAYLTEFEPIVTYADKLVVLEQKLNKTSSQASAIPANASLAQIAASLNSFAASIDSVLVDYKALSAPPLFTAEQAQNIEDFTRISSDFKSMAQAATARNASNIIKYSNDAQTVADTLSKREVKFASDLQHSSDLRTKADAILSPTKNTT